MNYHGIEIDYSRDDLFTFQARKLLEKHYMLETEASPQEAFARAALAYTDDLGLAQRIYDYASKGWFMFASPVLSNAPEVGQKAKALPISCFVAGTLVTCVDPVSKMQFLKPIEQIVVGDLVRTHMGRARKVLATKESVRDNVREVVVAGGAIKLQVTGDHPLYGWRDTYGDRGDFDWYAVDDIKPGMTLVACDMDEDIPSHAIKVAPTYHMSDDVVPPPIGCLWVDVTSVTPVEGEFTVYDIQVEEDESFVANGIVAHNCYLTYTPDSLSGLIDHSSEIRWLSVKGGGVGGHWSDVRSLSDKSPGPIPFLKTVDADMTAYRQGKCYSPDTEILTADGWVRFDRLEEGVEVAHVTRTGSVYFARPLELVVEDHDGAMVVLHGLGIDLIVTPNHSIVVQTADGSFSKVRADMLQADHVIPLFNDGSPSGSVSVSELEVLTLPYSGKVYCATVETGMIVVRRGGQAIVCGNTRKGSYAAYLDVSHPDIVEFINIRNPTGGDPNRKCLNLHNAVNITDAFMQACIDGRSWDLVDPADQTVRDTVDARHLFESILEMRARTGEPYLHFIDTSNRHLPEIMRQKGLKIRGSNLCMTGDQRVVTDRGLLTARELYVQGGELVVFDNEAPRKASAMELIDRDVPVFKITLKNGMTHTVTPEHKVKTTRGDVRCDQLVVGDEVFVQTNKGLFGNKPGPQTQALYGTLPSQIWEADELTQSSYIASVVWDYGYPCSKTHERLVEGPVAWLRDLQILFANCSGRYTCVDVDPTNPARGTWSTGVWVENIPTSEVVSVEPAGTEDVFCLTVESDSHHFIANGFVTHNCSEIFLATSEDRTAVCCLSSVNLSKFDEWSSTPMIRDLITYLDAVLQKFIEWAPDEISRARYSAMQERSLGLGAMGFHDYLQRNRLPWESAMAVGANHRMFSFMQREAVEATLALGRIHGEAPDLVSELQIHLADGGGVVRVQSSDFVEVTREGATVTVRAFDVTPGTDSIRGSGVERVEGLHSHSGRRNAHLLAIAPNANSALIANTSQGPDPRKSNAYASKTRVGTDLTLNPALEELLNERVPDQAQRDAIWSDIVKNNGSVQDVDVLTDWEKKVFATAFEIDQRWVVQHAGDRQNYICQGQSVNLFFPAESDRQDVLLTHVKAWKDGLKALYYYRTSTAVTAEKVSVQVERQALTDYVKTEDECLACHG